MFFQLVETSISSFSNMSVVFVAKKQTLKITPEDERMVVLCSPIHIFVFWNIKYKFCKWNLWEELWPCKSLFSKIKINSSYCRFSSKFCLTSQTRQLAIVCIRLSAFRFFGVLEMISKNVDPDKFFSKQKYMIT